MRRFAAAALACGLAVGALAGWTVIVSASAATAGQSRAAAAMVTPTPTPTPTTSGRPRRPRHRHMPPPAPPPPPRPTGPPPPAAGMPHPSANCISQQAVTQLTGEPWAQRALDFSSAWDVTQGRHVTVAVVDSGIDYTPQLVGRVTRTDLTGSNGEDCIPHGTLVASIIAAGNEQARGIPFYGVAPQAHILSIRVQQQEGTSSHRVLADIATGIRYAVAHRAGVINVSIQVSASYPALRAAVAYALKRNVVVVAAAGNDTAGSGQGPFYPASYPGVLSVNAVDQFGQLGGFDVSRTPVSVTAPGVDIASDYPGGFAPANTINGTSFAAAFVSGEAALVRAAHPKFTAAQVVQRIIRTADGSTGPHTGAGMINPVEAVTKLLPQTTVTRTPAAAVPIPRPKPVDPVTRTVALAVTGGAVAAAALVAAAAIVVPRGRQRHWRPGRLGSAPASPAPLPPPTPRQPLGPGQSSEPGQHIHP
ncbi:MAG TPA: S8 family serine peptidase [Streptosporangiaceae bacterium]|nr:S8 family serine peptidase [Streptosporangiaceae bacterium]